MFILIKLSCIKIKVEMNIDYIDNNKLISKIINNKDIIIKSNHTILIYSNLFNQL